MPLVRVVSTLIGGRVTVTLPSRTHPSGSAAATSRVQPPDPQKSGSVR